MQQWLQNKHTETKGHFASSPEGLNLVVDLSGKSSSIKGNKSSPKPKGFPFLLLDFNVAMNLKRKEERTTLLEHMIILVICDCDL